MSRLTAVLRVVELTTTTVSPKRTMLPPIWVAAWDSHRRRNAGCGRRPGRPAGWGLVGRGRRSRRHVASRGPWALGPDEQASRRR